jgi:hypothetical protein
VAPLLFDVAACPGPAAVGVRIPPRLTMLPWWEIDVVLLDWSDSPLCYPDLFLRRFTLDVVFGATGG